MRERGKNRKSEKVTPENFLERFVFQLGQITSFYHFPIKSWFKLFLYVKIHGNMLFSSYHPYSNANISFCKKCWLGNKKTLSYKINLYFWPWTPNTPLTYITLNLLRLINEKNTVIYTRQTRRFDQVRNSFVLLLIFICFWILRYLYINGVLNFVLFIGFGLFLFHVYILKSYHDSHRWLPQR